MGDKKTITATRFPRQRESHGHVRVCFHYDTRTPLWGEIVRDDAEAPHVMIIRLDDGRYVLATECQWQPARDAEAG